MVQQLIRLVFIYIVLIGVACSSVHIDTRTKYQKKTIKKFSSKPRYFHKGPGFHVRKNIQVFRSGTYRHPAVTKSGRKKLNSESWLKKIGEGEIDY